jgi:signal transduction histidine kinase
MFLEVRRIFKERNPWFDLIIVSVVTLASSFILFSSDAFEHLRQFLDKHEHWELDEFFLTALVFGGALSWFAWRRWQKRLDLSLTKVRQSELYLLDAIESMAEGFALYDRNEQLVLCNTQYLESFPNLSQIEGLFVSGMKFEDLVRAGAERGLPIAARRRVEEFVLQRLRSFRDPKGPREYQQPRGNWIRYEERKTTDGGTVCIRTDITETRLAQEQLHQSQKMEIVGQLTGGMAHDVNNLLAIIIGNLDFLANELKQDDKLVTLVERATNAALKGADLNRQLLAFSRKQTLLPQIIDVNKNIDGMSPMLHRALGETIEFHTNLSQTSVTAEVDAAQLESAVLNLAINARDAMPTGGSLSIETKKVPLDVEFTSERPELAPGDYVMVTVSDTGLGMSPDTVKRVFEPFFTTKDVGKGSGLGLSMVFGFAKQSNGYVEIESAVGNGTKVKLYLPCAQKAPTEVQRKQRTIPEARDETVLIVEDNPELLDIVRTQLVALGYKVRQAHDGPSALRELDTDSNVDLLLTDVLMPGGMSGPELVEDAVARHPNLKTLYMSGHAFETLPQLQNYRHSIAVLRKPFRVPELARMIRTALDS